MGHKWVYPKAQFKTLRIRLTLTDLTTASPFCFKKQAMFLNFVTWSQMLSSLFIILYKHVQHLHQWELNITSLLYFTIVGFF